MDSGCAAPSVKSGIFLRVDFVGVDVIFVSYSRDQLYFAESLTLHMQQHSLDVWFDLQQLSPGSDWQARIHDGLSRCDQLVLIVSKAALSSPYVAAEWEAARAADKPITLVLFEAASLPEGLQKCPVFDFRRTFNRPMANLARHLNHTEVAPTAFMPPPNRLHVRLTMPLHIVYLLVTMSITSIASVGVAIWATRRSGPNSASLLLLVGMLWVGYTTLQFARRRADYRGVRLVMAVFASVTLFFPLLAMSFVTLLSVLVGEVRFLGEIWAWMVGGLLVAGLAGYGYFYILNFSGDLLRWFPAGKVSQGFRQRINRRVLRHPLGLGVTYQLHYASADGPTAQTIRYSFQHAPLLREVQDDAAHHLILVSNHTPVNDLATWAEQYQDKMILVVIAPIQVPDLLGFVLRYQWVDFIGRDTQQMKQLAENLQNPDRGRVGYALATVPQRVERFRTPGRITLLLLYVRNAAASSMAIGLHGLFRPFDGEELSMPLCILLMTVGLVGMGLVHGVISRRIPLWLTILLFVTLMVVPALSLRHIGDRVTVQPGDSLYRIAERECGVGYVWRTIRNENDLESWSRLRVGTELQVNCGVIGLARDVLLPISFAVVIVVIAAIPLWMWLPRRVVARRPAPTLQLAHGHWLLLLVSAVWVAVTFALTWSSFG